MCGCNAESEGAMTQEEILALGIQADLCDEYGTINWEYGFKNEIIAFAKLVEKRKCEELANKIDQMPFGDTSASFAIWVREQQ